MQEGLSGLLTAMFPFGLVVLGIAIAAAVWYWSYRRKRPGEERRADRATDAIYQAEERDAERKQDRVQSTLSNAR